MAQESGSSAVHTGTASIHCCNLVIWVGHGLWVLQTEQCRFISSGSVFMLYLWQLKTLYFPMLEGFIDLNCLTQRQTASCFSLSAYENTPRKSVCLGKTLSLNVDARWRIKFVLNHNIYKVLYSNIWRGKKSIFVNRCFVKVINFLIIYWRGLKWQSFVKVRFNIKQQLVYSWSWLPIQTVSSKNTCFWLANQIVRSYMSCFWLVFQTASYLISSPGWLAKLLDNDSTFWQAH